MHFKKLYTLIIDILKHFSKNNISVFAAQSSFFILLSAIPFFMLLLGALTLFFPLPRFDFFNTVTELVPEEISQFITYITNEIFSRKSGSLISLTAVTTLWSASRGVLAIIKGLNCVYENPEYSYFGGRILAFFYTFLFIITLSLTPIALLLEQLIMKSASQNLHYLVVFFLLICLFALFYAYLPRRKSSFISQIPGSIFTASGWILFTFIYTFYIDNYSSFPRLYGSLGAVVLSMLWLYFCVNIFLLGAELNRALAQQKFMKK